MERKVKGVIFDMDGLMVDSESLTYKNNKKIMSEMGYDLTFDIFKQTIGFSNAKTRKLYIDIFGENIDCDKLRLESIRMYREDIEKNGVPIKEGLFELLDYLKNKGIKLGVATSTSKMSAMYTLERADIVKYMDALVFGDMVENSKPSPDIYIKACKMIGEEPEDCVGIEDSYNGVRAVYSAKMTAIMVPDILKGTEEMEEKSYKIVGSLREVIQLI